MLVTNLQYIFNAWIQAQTCSTHLQCLSTNQLRWVLRSVGSDVLNETNILWSSDTAPSIEIFKGTFTSILLIIKKSEPWNPLRKEKLRLLPLRPWRASPTTYCWPRHAWEALWRCVLAPLHRLCVGGGYPACPHPLCWHPCQQNQPLGHREAKALSGQEGAGIRHAKQQAPSDNKHLQTVHPNRAWVPNRLATGFPQASSDGKEGPYKDLIRTSKILYKDLFALSPPTSPQHNHI